MKELIQISEVNTMSSREIAELTGKRHDHILRDCDVLNESYEKIPLPKIGEGYYTHPNTGNQQHREYLLTKMQCFDLMTGYSTELRIKVNRRWEELERNQQFQVPSSFKEALLLAAQQQEQIEKQQKQIDTMRPKEVFTDAVTGSQSSCLIGELAKILRQNGIEIGEKRLFQWLRNNGYLGKCGERYNIPNQQYVEQGLFELKKGVRTGNGGVLHTTVTTKVTGKGQVYFINKFLTEKAA
jgi:anti-repressor protein